MTEAHAWRTVAQAMDACIPKDDWDYEGICFWIAEASWKGGRFARGPLSLRIERHVQHHSDAKPYEDGHAPYLAPCDEEHHGARILMCLLLAHEAEDEGQ